MKISKINFNGRYSISDDNVYIYNGGSGFSFLMKGKGFGIDLRSIGGDGYYYIIIDKDYSKKTKVLAKDKYRYSFNNDDLHRIDVFKANEANDNTLILIDLNVDGELLDFSKEPQKRVVVYGDSTIAGFGILAKSGEASIHNSDAVEDFCFQALYELGLDADILSASGYGLVFSPYTCPNNIGIIDFFDKLKVHSDVSWNNNRKNDLLIISLGTNDNAYIQENSQNREKLIKKFKEKYQQLIDSEIKKNPNLKVLMVYGTLNEENTYYLIEETYQYLRPLYKNLYIHKFNGDNSAISNHAFVDTHKRMAEELKEALKSIL